MIIFVDGTFENVMRGRQLGSSVKRVAPHVVVTGIAIKYRQDTLTKERISEILGMPVHLLDFNDTSFGTQIIEIVKQLLSKMSEAFEPAEAK